MVISIKLRDLVFLIYQLFKKYCIQLLTSTGTLKAIGMKNHAYLWPLLIVG